MKSVKVLHIITRLDRGGSATNTIETLARFRRDLFDATLLSGRTKDPDGEIQAQLEKKGIRYAWLPSLVRDPDLWNDLKAFVQLYFFIRKGHYDIVHTHSSKAGILGRWAAWLAGVPHILHSPHGHIFYGYYSAFVTRIFIGMEWLTSKITEKIITLTQIEKEDHLKFKIAPAAKFVPIYSGIDIEHFSERVVDRAKVRKALGVSEKAPLIGSVARLDPVKGNRYVVESIPEVLRRFPEAVLLLVGDGSERGFLEQRVRDLGISGHVKFLGFRDDVADLLHTIDVFVLASVNEGMGRVLLEAMACRKPVIATRTGSIPEIVRDGENGMLVPVSDAAALSRAMVELFSNAEKAAGMAQKGKEFVSEVFSTRYMVQCVEKLYQEVTGVSD